jgi:hypothetical protein
METPPVVNPQVNMINMNTTQQTETNVMATEAMTPTPLTQATTANESAAINPMLQKWVDFLELISHEAGPAEDNNCVAPWIQEAEEIRKIKAKKRQNYKLRKLEIEQKKMLLAEAQNRREEARRKFEAQEQLPYDYTERPPATINDILQAQKQREELIALEREQKEALYNEVMEKRAKELGEQWPPTEEDMYEKLRFDQIPKRWPGYKDIIDKAFPGASPIKSQEPHE